jgi:predicted secreted protein
VERAGRALQAERAELQVTTGLHPEGAHPNNVVGQAVQGLAAACRSARPNTVRSAAASLPHVISNPGLCMHAVAVTEPRPWLRCHGHLGVQVSIAISYREGHFTHVLQGPVLIAMHVNASQERLAEVRDHEAQLGAWKARFKAAAQRQLAEREAALGEREAALQLQEQQLAKQVRGAAAKEAAAADKLAKVSIAIGSSLPLCS